MNKSRDHILSRLRTARPMPMAAQAEAADRPQVAADRKQAAVEPRQTDQSSCQVTELSQELEASHARVIRISAADLPAALAEVCQHHGIQHLMHGDRPELASILGGLPDSIEAKRFERPLEQHKTAMFKRTQAGLSIACAGIARTGTLLLRTGPEEPRTLSLVPPVHFVILEVSRIVPDMQTALAEAPWGNRLPTNLLMISGPSKTADIQTTLAYGAHGPKVLVVFLLEEALRITPIAE